MTVIVCQTPGTTQVPSSAPDRRSQASSGFSLACISIEEEEEEEVLPSVSTLQFFRFSSPFFAAAVRPSSSASSSPLVWYLVPETCFPPSDRDRVLFFFPLSASAAVGETASEGGRSEGSRPPLIPNQPFLSAVPHSSLRLLVSQVQRRGVVTCDGGVGGWGGGRLSEAKWRRRNLQSVETKEAFFPPVFLSLRCAHNSK